MSAMPCCFHGRWPLPPYSLLPFPNRAKDLEREREREREKNKTLATQAGDFISFPIADQPVLAQSENSLLLERRSFNYLGLHPLSSQGQCAYPIKAGHYIAVNTGNFRKPLPCSPRMRKNTFYNAPSTTSKQPRQRRQGKLARLAP